MHLNRLIPLVALTSFIAPVALFAVDGVILIDQNKVLAGNVTPGDLPGFPVTISQPGSYRLDSNLTVPSAATSAIVVTAANVNIDLNGFSILGPNVCASVGGPGPLQIVCTYNSTGIGIDASASANVSVQHGSIVGMGKNGIFAFNTVSITGVLVKFSGSHGMSVNDGLVDSCRVTLNGAAGIAHFFSGSNHAGNGIVRNSWIFQNNSWGLLEFFPIPGLWGFQGNVLSSNQAGITNADQQVNGFLNLGSNLCGNALCP